MVPDGKLEAIQHLVARIEAANRATLRRRILSAIAICSFVLLASLWLGAALVKAQESPSDRSAIAVTRPAIVQPSVENTQASHLVLGMVDRSEIEASSVPNSAVQLANPHPTGRRGAEKILIPAESRSSEYVSLAALASAPSSAMLNAVRGKMSGHADADSPASGNKTLVYQLGAVNFVINGLPNSFSISSAGRGATGQR